MRCVMQKILWVLLSLQWGHSVLRFCNGPIRKESIIYYAHCRSSIRPVLFRCTAAL